MVVCSLLSCRLTKQSRKGILPFSSTYATHSLILWVPDIPTLLIIFVKRLNSPTTYFVHCDLIDKRQNLLNGTPSTVLARFNIRGQPFEKVHHQTPQQNVLRDTSTGDYDANSITRSVRDEKGELFDFNGQPLEFELEIN